MEEKVEKQAEGENFYLTKTPVKKLLLKFAIPCVLAMLVSALYNIVDQIFLGNSFAGRFGIMATTLVFPFTVVALALAQLIGDGCAALFSISLGAKDEKTTRKTIGNSIILVIVASLILVILGYALTNPILSLLGANGYDETTRLYTKQYLMIILAGVPFYMFSSATVSIIRADGSPKYSMLATVIGAIVNIIFDPILIFACKMGVQGAALATIIGQIVSAIFCAVYFRKVKLVKLKKDSFQPDKKVIGRTLKLGISSLITQLSIAVITIVANNVVGAIGGEHATDAGAALGIVFKVFAIVIAFCLGIAVGAQPIVGYNYGAKKYNRVLEALKLVIISNIILGIIATILFEVAPNIIVMMFGSGSDYYKEYANLSFRIYLGGILFCCLQKASCIFLQSIDKPYKAMLLSLTRDVILLVPGVCLLGFLGNLKIMLWAGIIADVGSFIPTFIFVLLESRKLRKALPKEETNAVPSTPTFTDRFVITIDREFGSGGKFIGQELAKKFGITCYDNELVTKVAKEFNLDIDTLNNIDEKQKSSFWYSFATNYVFDNKNKKEVMPISPEDNLFLKQAKTIEELYETENCVIIGRCADYILQDKNIIKLFIYSSNLDFKVKRKSKFEGTTEKQTKANIKKIDKQRADYYNHFTSLKWGEKSNYDLCIDTSKLGVEESVDFILEYCKRYLEKYKSVQTSEEVTANEAIVEENM